MRIWLLAALAAAGPAQAEITKVFTNASVTTTLRNDAFGNPIVNSVGGTVLSGKEGSAAFGSGGSYASVSRVSPEYIYFKNANAAAGQQVTVDSYTLVDIHLRNDGDTAVRPVLQSTILAAGLGLYVGGNCLNDVAGCAPRQDLTGLRRTFDSFGPGLPGDFRIAGAAFDFRISSGGSLLYDLTGFIDYIIDPTTSERRMFMGLDRAASTLNNYRSSFDTDLDQHIGYQWDDTPITINFTDLLAPGDETVLTYETRVTSYSYTNCTNLLTGTCLNAYSAFGDPVGKGSSVPTQNRAAFGSNAAETAGLAFDLFTFNVPTFEKGQLTFVSNGSVVPEPGTWAMMIAGFGMVGAAARRRRALA